MWFGNFLSLDYRIESGRTAENVVRLDSQHLPESITRSMAKERPDFHLPETLTTVLGFASQGLLSDEGVGTDGAHMYLIFDHVMKFKNIHIADSNFLVKCFAGATVEEIDLARLFEVRFDKFFLNLILGRAGKWRHDCLVIESMGGETQMHL